jgi:hypothetical protein
VICPKFLYTEVGLQPAPGVVELPFPESVKGICNPGEGSHFGNWSYYILELSERQEAFLCFARIQFSLAILIAVFDRGFACWSFVFLFNV